MSSVLRMLSIRMPRHMKKKQIEALFEITARALDCPEPDISRLNHEEAIEAFSDFMAQQVTRLHDEGTDMEAINARLYKGAHKMGVVLSESGHLSGKDIYPALELVYKNIDAVIEGSLPGRVIINRCYSNTEYTPEVCDFMAQLDYGIIAGMCGNEYSVTPDEVIEGSRTCETSFSIVAAR